MKTLKDHIISYCGIDILRPALMNPVLINGMVYATDANRAIRVPLSKVDFEVKENPKYPGLEAIWNSVAPTERIRVHVDEIKAGLSKIELVNDTKDCPECEGSGKIECECCGHEKDCEDCDGDGGIEVEGQLVPNYSRHVMLINEVGFNPKYLSDAVELVEAVGDAYLYATALYNGKPCLFQAGEVELLIMPMMWPKGDEYSFLKLVHQPAIGIEATPSASEGTADSPAIAQNNQ